MLTRFMDHPACCANKPPRRYRSSALLLIVGPFAPHLTPSYTFVSCQIVPVVSNSRPSSRISSVVLVLTLRDSLTRTIQPKQFSAHIRSGCIYLCEVGAVYWYRQTWFTQDTRLVASCSHDRSSRASEIDTVYHIVISERGPAVLYSSLAYFYYRARPNFQQKYL